MQNRSKSRRLTPWDGEKDVGADNLIPYSAYERGSNENMNRIIRWFCPKGTNFDTITAAEVARVEEWLANYPRRIREWKTPQMLHDEYMTVAA